MNPDLPLASIEPGRYVVAVSGGVDSMALLHRLRTVPDLELVVAHLDHGVRSDSAEDEQLVRRTAADYGFAFESQTVKLGPTVSEAEARRVRYEFLHQVQKKYNARAIITAHHQDDVLETACINLLRGTGRRGLTSLQSGQDIARPLLNVSKAQIAAYARQHHVVWHEDSTNASDVYLRNRVRRHMAARMSLTQRHYVLRLIAKQTQLNQAIDAELRQWAAQHVILNDQEGTARLSRYQLIMLPPEVAAEVLQFCIQQLTGKTALSHQVWLALEALKVLRPHKQYGINLVISAYIEAGGMIKLTVQR